MSWCVVMVKLPITSCLQWQPSKSSGYSFHGGMFKLNATIDTDLLLYSLSNFECNGHTVHMLTQWHQLPPLTSTVKLSLFMHVHSSPLFLAARLHGHHGNHSCSINNGCIFSRKTFQIDRQIDRQTDRQTDVGIQIYEVCIGKQMQIDIQTYRYTKGSEVRLKCLNPNECCEY